MTVKSIIEQTIPFLIPATTLVIGGISGIFFERLSEKRTVKKRQPQITEYLGSNSYKPDVESAKFCFAKTSAIMNLDTEESYFEYRMKECTDYQKYLNAGHHFIWIQADYRKLTVESFTKQDEITQENRIIDRHLMNMNETLSHKHLVLIIEKNFVPSAIELFVEHDVSNSRRYKYSRNSFDEWKK
ncbi:hypothetical protein HCJ57_15760 [Listeria booriae]|uniref:hypothetical protein n=1 Tax=Listeria booriae TaxID=1552123 RepID=UPI00162A6AFF|nr:hypothetical protein [Listeria booriae]MBC2057982.1 hypothetical protein [Listeria booriae]